MSKANGSIEEFEEREAKVVIVGEANVGKSAIVLRFVSNDFVESATSTIGAAFLTKTIVTDRAIIKLNLWDTAGAERYRSLAAMYYRGVDVGLICYDVTDRKSFAEVQSYWIHKLREEVSGDGIRICIIGNKKDLAEQREVTEAEGMALAQSFGFYFFETSALTGEGVQEVFTTLASQLPSLRSSISKNYSLEDRFKKLDEEKLGMKNNCC